MRQSILLATAVVTISMVSARCNNVEFTLYGLKLVEGANITAEEGYTTSGGQRPVSEVVNCTEAAGKTEDCDFYHYPMVISMEPSINETVDNRRQIFELVREKAAPATALLTNFNETINWNFTVPNATVRFGVEAQYHLLPYKRCWVGHLSDCDDKDKAIDGKNVSICGFPWKEGTEEQPVDRQQYEGEMFLYYGDFSNASLASNEPQKPADEFDWAAYGNEIKEDNAETGDAGHMHGVAENSVLAFSVVCAALAFF